MDSEYPEGLETYSICQEIVNSILQFDTKKACILVNNGRSGLVSYFKETALLELFKQYLLIVFVLGFVNKVFQYIKWYGLFGSIRRLYRCVAKKIFVLLLNSPFLRKTVEKEVKTATDTIEKDLIKNSDSLIDFEELPKHGLSNKEVLNELDKLQNCLPYSHWEDGRVSGAVYHGGDELIKLQSQAFEMYAVANQLHPDVFPGVRKMESEVVSMTLKLFNAPENTGCGTTTSGGTESLLMACLSAKWYGYHHKGIKNPEMIVPVTAHAGFDKASYYFGIKMHHVEVDPVTYKVDLKKVESFINRNTVLLVGSAPNFPHGIIDDIEGLGKIAKTHNIPLHVDCCLGSFIVAYMKKAGFTDIPLFDFQVPGVTSISCDTHKYGFAPKGSSIIMYRNADLRKQQYFVTSDWVGGLYGSPTLAGSRPGALVVGCWATMVHLGEDGYISSCKEIIGAAKVLRNYIEENIPQLTIIGDPKLSVISFKSDVINVYDLADKLSAKGWHLSSLQNPAALHFAITKLSVPSVDLLATTLKELVAEELHNSTGISSTVGTSAIYGVAGSVKTTGISDKLIVSFLDTLYKVKPTD
ncbi:hypothetical protein TPHA_0D01840 [Tetrapisispora phaffii CBS 4417]|uniref:sphinganine-1-phosphate aldolase n=1 Tax=Tetrapisispora phaffii (strain ATCC 24235 / CBS 4417 / NBRC 1672 / NRRL Y-8282 / UCD 70-5) TaxID=1071381 RepID=G8BSK2_TETPH|nr:hypothetical protein TPHA_0D01840 [Tetrapisispora phaffii CBS 4417]CCE62823.1 hypothetical protein TPHA_0D01840 [Tetrapisispora phaffii CBS 4417]